MHTAENILLRAEKMAAIAALLRRVPYPASRLSEAWENTLDSQHHDAWVVAKNGRGRQNWAWQVDAQTWETERICAEVISDCAEALATGSTSAPDKRLGTRFVRVFNTTGRDRSGVVELNLTGDIGMQTAKVFDEKGRELASQLVVRRKFVSRDVVSAMIAKEQVRPPAQGLKPNQQWSSREGGAGLEYLPGESMNAGQLLFQAAAPAVGYSTYRIEPVYETGHQVPGTGRAAWVSQEPGGFITVETDLYRVRIDPRRGGIFSTIYSKKMEREFVDTANARLFNEYRGYFINEKQWFSSAETPVDLQIVEEGPMRVRLALSGKVGPHPFRSTVTLAAGDPRIEFGVRFQFQPNTWIGDPWRIPSPRSRIERRRSYHDDRWKLNAFFPVALANQVVYKDAAYDVCRSKLVDTFYQRWDEAKHNVILNWIDVLDEHTNQGIALFSDQVTSYVHGKDHPPALVLAWGWDGAPFFGDCPLEGEHEASYAIMPHAGRWDEAEVWQASRERGEPLLPQLMRGEPATQNMRYSLVRVSGSGYDVPTAIVEGNHLLVRLFNAGADNSTRMVSIPMKSVAAQLVELDGRTIKPLQVSATADGRYGVALAIPRFGVRTVRFALTLG
jgi:alpha-mannosidase